jgi:hypothetical protein
LHKENPFIGAPLRDLIQGDGRSEVFFIAEDEEDGIGGSLECHLIPDILEVGPAAGVALVVDHHYSLAGLEVGRHDRSELLLPGRVPHAQPYLPFLQLDRLVPVVNCGHRAVRNRLVMDVPPED